MMRAWLRAAIGVGLAAIAPSLTPAQALPYSPDDHACEGTSSVTSQIVQCLDDANTQADHALQRLYTLLLRELSAGSSSPYPVFFKENKADLMKAERAWISFARAQCQLQGDLLAPGTGVPVETEHCVLLLTNERIRFLTRMEQQIRHDSNLCDPDPAKCAP